MKKRRIAVVTARRGEYGGLKPVLEAMEAREDLECGLIVTSMHLEEIYGYSIKEIEKNGHTIYAKIKCAPTDDSRAGMAREVSIAIEGIVKTLQEIKPDILVVSTDLGVPLAGAIAGSVMNIPVAHLDAGEISGSIDDSLRHATTKLSHILFTTSEIGKERLLRMGEEPFRIFNVGYARIDHIINKKYANRTELFKKLNLNLGKNLVILIQHSVTTEEKLEEKFMETINAILEASKEDKSFQVLLIYPNVDAGSKRIIEIIKKYENVGPFKVFNNLDTDIFLDLLKYTKVIVGNTSCGIAEAPSFCLPAVNIGTRQQGRERANNVIDVGYNKDEIKAALKKALYDEKFLEGVKNCKSPYGDGKTSQRVAEILATIDINQKLMQKRMTY